MGGGVSLDAELGEAKTITAGFCASFAKNYSKCYLLGLMKEAQKAQEKAAKGNPWKLLKCEKDPPAPERKKGVMKKLSKHLKNWNDRYMVVRGDWIIDYYETEEKFKTAPAKPRGTINMSAYGVNDDVNNTLINRIIELAKKCNLDVEAIPKPDKYPDFTIELYHERREAIYLQALNADEFKAWADMLRNCRYYAPTLNINDDKTHKWAFSRALWRSRWECDMWGWWYGGGGEEMQISDAINERIGDVVMGRVDAKLTMPWAVRSRIRNGFMKTTGGFVSSAVTPMWKAAYEGVQKVKKEVAEKIAAMMAPITEAQLTVQQKIIDAVSAAAKPHIDDTVAPKLAPLLDAVFGPVIDGFRILMGAFDDAVAQGVQKFEKRDDNMYLVWHYGWQSKLWDADYKMWDLYDLCWALRTVFEDVSPWGIIWKARRRLRKNLHNALFTLETKVNSGTPWDQAVAETRVLLLEDQKTGVMRTFGHVLFGVVEGFWEKIVIRPARKVVEPIAELIPEALRDFIDVMDMLEKVLYNILRAACALIFEPCASRISF